MRRLTIARNWAKQRRKPSYKFMFDFWKNFGL